MLSIDKQLLAHRFSRCAETYESATPVQARMAAELARRIERRLSPKRVRRILELGCGTGRLTEELRRMFPAAELTAVDLSGEMIERARQRCADADYHVIDAEEFVRQMVGPVDLVASSAAVQWFHDPAATLQICHNWLAPGGCLAVATFGQETFRELRRSFAQAYRLEGRPPESHILPLRPLEFWRTLFGGGDLDEVRISLTFPDVPAFLQSIRRAGVSNSSQRRVPLSPRILQRMIDCYTSAFRISPASTIPATYHIIYGLWTSAEKRPCGSAADDGASCEPHGADAFRL